MLARARQTLEEAESEPAGRVLDLSEMEERVLMSAAPMAVVAQVADVATLNPSASAANETSAANVAAHSVAADYNSTSTADTGLSKGEQLEFVLMAVDQQLGDVITEAAATSDSNIAVPTIAVINPVSAETQVAETSSSTQPVAPTATVKHELVFVDPQLADFEKLTSDILSANGPTRQIDVVLLSSQRDGIEQITQVLAEHHDLDAIHILSHGVDGALELGGSWLNAVSLEARASEIAQWNNALALNGDILIYGCNVAADAHGQALIDRLAEITGADVAASRDATGNAALGGNWDLEYATGSIESDIAIDTLAQQEWNGVFAIVADTTSSSNTGAAGATSLTWSHIVNSGMNQVLIVEFASDSKDGTVTSLTYAGQALTLVGRGKATGGRVEIWELVSPTVGTANIVANFNNKQQVVAGAVDFFGVDQTAPTGTFISAGGTSTAPSVDVTSAIGDIVIDALWGNDGVTATAGAGQTVQWTNATGSSTNFIRGAGSTEAGAASVTMSWTLNSSVQWVDGGVSLHQFVNSAPMLDASKSPVLTAESEDSGAPIGAVGTLVSSLIDFASPSGQVDNVTDANAGAVTGIAVTATDTTQGTWFYSTNNGGSWTTMGAVSDTSARLLAADANTRIYFQPDAQANGTLANAITFRAWDQITGSNGTLANTSTNGGTTAFSSSTDTASLVVTSANDAPTLANWYDSAWSYRKEIVIDHTRVSGGADLANFTVLVDLGSDAGLAAHALANGNDILFTSVDGTTKLSHEIDTFVSASGHLLAWVKVPTLFAATDTPLFMYYGNAAAANQQDAAGTWNNSYAGVWHLGQTSTGAVGEFIDSTANNNAGRGTGGPSSVAGMFGNGQDFNGTSNFISIPNAASLQLTSVMTLEGWINSRSFGSSDDVDIIVRKGDVNPNNYQLALYNAQPTLQLDQGEGAGLVAGTADTANTWHHVVGTWDGTTRSIYLDGVLLGTDNFAAPIGTDLRDLYIGGRIGNTDTVDGIVDEVRVESVVRSAGWIATEYNNATSAGSFMSVRSEQSQSIMLTSTDENTSSSGTTADSILIAAGWNDVDAGALNGLAITAESGNGTWQYSTDGASWTDFGPVSATSALLISSTTQVRYVPDGNNGETATFGFVAWDQTSDTASTNGSPSHANPGAGGGSTAYSSESSTAMMTITAINDAPLLTVPVLQTINEDALLTFSSVNGNQIAISDVDAGGSSVQFTVSAANGTLTLNGITGLTFLSGDGTADASMQFTGSVAAINTALNGMSFASTANFNGGAGLGFVVSDLGNAGSGGALTANGGLGIIVNSVNDAPAGIDKTVTTPEDTAYTFVASDFDFTDVNDSPANTLTAVKIATLPGAGTLTDNGTAVTVGQIVSLADINGGLLRFTPVTNANGANYASFTFFVQDNGGTANGGVDFDQTPNTLTISVTAVNDAPVITSNGGGATAALSVAENTTAVTVVTSTDVDGGVPVYSISGGADAAKFTIDSSTGALSFVSAPNYESPTDFGSDNIYDVTVRVNDGTLTDTQAIAVTVNNVNESSVSAISDNNAASNSVSENQIAGTTVGVTAFASDADGPDLVIYTLDNNAGGLFAINAGTGVVTTTAPLDAETATSYLITVRATSTDTSFTTRDFTIAVADVNEFAISPLSDTDAATNAINENSANGTVVGVTAFASDADVTNNAITYSLTNSAGGQFAIDPNSGVVTVAGLIDREAGAVRTITIRGTSADGSSVTQDFNIAVNDVNEFAVTPLIDNNPALNNVTENAAVGTTVGLTAFASDADATTNSITYSLDDNAGGRFAIDGTTGVVTVAGALDYEAATSHSIIVRATSADLSGTTRGFTINVNDANDNAPVIAFGQTFSVSEFAAVSDSLGTVSASDVDTVGTLQNWQITGGNSDGVFAINTATGEITIANTAKLDYETTPTYSLTLTVSDSANTSAPQTIAIDILNVNEAPVNSVPGPQTVAEDTPLVFSAVNGNAISVSDVDVGSGLLGVRLTVTNGTLTLGSTSNLSFGLGDGVNDRDMILVGTVADVNAALAGLTYQPDANFNGNETLSIQTRDFGNAGSGGEQLDNDVIAIVVTPVNDLPVASDDNYSVKQTGALTVAVPGVIANDSDIDHDPLTVVLVTGPAHGSLTLNADGSFTYTPVAAFLGADSFTYQIHDVTSTGNLATVNLTVTQSIGGVGSTGDPGSGSGSGGNTNSGGGSGVTPHSVPTLVPVGNPIASGGNSNTNPASSTTTTNLPVDSTATFVPATTEESAWKFLTQSHSDRSRLAGLSASEIAMNTFNSIAAMDRALISTFDDSGVIWTKLDDLKRDFEQDVQANLQSLNLVVRTTAAVGSSLTVGYVLWLLRGGTLIASMVSTLPAWTLIDPLPILDTYALGRDDDDDAESLNTLIEGSGQVQT